MEPDGYLGRRASGGKPRRPRAMDVLQEQRERFRKRFGRDPGPRDPAFFDEDADVPTPMSAVKVQAESIDSLREAGAPPEVV